MKEKVQLPALPKSELMKLQVVDSYSRFERNELAGEEDPSQTGSYHLKWRPTEKHFLIIEGEKTVCHVGLLKHTVEVDRLPIHVAGIGGVVTRPECRGQGYAQLAMKAAESFAFNQMAVDFILLFCRPALSDWYEHLGWTVVVSQVWVEQEPGTILFPLMTMVRCKGESEWPRGEIYLGSLPW